VQQGELKEIQIGDVPVAEGHEAAEMMLIGSSIKVAPVVQWDGQAIGDGKPGRLTMKLLQMWNEDLHAPDQLVPVPYGEGV
jgi:branched-subunit amino acid aminotransferase/4-amino-4-deoxychorismate lyase